MAKSKPEKSKGSGIDFNFGANTQRRPSRKNGSKGGKGNAWSRYVSGK
jgi:hypothetical protein